MDWLRTNKLRLNPDKMEILFVDGPSVQLKGVLGGDVIPPPNRTRFTVQSPLRSIMVIRGHRRPQNIGASFMKLGLVHQVEPTIALSQKREHQGYCFEGNGLLL